MFISIYFALYSFSQQASQEKHMLIANNQSVRFVTVLTMLLAGLLITGCTWVKATPNAERVRIVPADRVADCAKIGDLSVYTKSRVAGVNRKAAIVKQELETLARNEAAEMGADTIISASDILDGRQSFIAYRCL